MDQHKQSLQFRTGSLAPKSNSVHKTGHWGPKTTGQLKCRLLYILENKHQTSCHSSIRWASHCFLIEKVGRQEFLYTILARPLINNDIKNLKTMRGTRYLNI